MIFANIFLFSSHTTKVTYNFYEIFTKIAKIFSIIVYKDLKIHKEYERTMGTQSWEKNKTEDIKLSNFNKYYKMQQFA